MKQAVKALSLKGEEYDDDDDAASQNHFTNRAITVFDVVGNLTSLGLNRIFMSKEYKQRIKREVVYVSEKSLEDVHDNVLKKCESVGGKLNLKFTSKNLAGKNKVELTFQGGQGVVKLAVTIQQVSEKPQMYWISLTKLRGPLLSYVNILRALQQPGRQVGQLRRGCIACFR